MIIIILIRVTLPLTFFSAVYRNECSPGPAYLVTHTRFGLDGTPVYSMLGRAKDASKYLLAASKGGGGIEREGSSIGGPEEAKNY